MNVENRDLLKTQIQVNESKIESTVSELEQLRFELEHSHTATEESNKLHSEEVNNLKVALADVTANLETELSAKLEVSNER